MGKFETETQRIKAAFSAALLPTLALGLLLLATESGSKISPLTASLGNSEYHESIQESIFSSETVAPQKKSPQPKVGISYVYSHSLNAKVTGYTPGEESCGIYADGFTSTGSNAWTDWGIAADPKHLPYGTIVFIPGVGYREVDDTGSAMRKAWREDKATHIDLRFSKVKDALQWGVRKMNVHVFVPEEPTP